MDPDTVRHPEFGNLTPVQHAAVDILLTGLPISAAAGRIGVTRRTLFRWFSDDPHFNAELNKRRNDITRAVDDRLRTIALAALDTVENAVNAGNLQASLAVLRGTGALDRRRSLPQNENPAALAAQAELLAQTITQYEKNLDREILASIRPPDTKLAPSNKRAPETREESGQTETSPAPSRAVPRPESQPINIEPLEPATPVAAIHAAPSLISSPCPFTPKLKAREISVETVTPTPATHDKTGQSETGLPPTRSVPRPEPQPINIEPLEPATPVAAIHAAPSLIPSPCPFTPELKAREISVETVTSPPATHDKSGQTETSPPPTRSVLRPEPQTIHTEPRAVREISVETVTPANARTPKLRIEPLEPTSPVAAICAAPSLIPNPCPFTPELEAREISVENVTSTYATPIATRDKPGQTETPAPPTRSPARNPESRRPIQNPAQHRGGNRPRVLTNASTTGGRRST